MPPTATTPRDVTLIHRTNSGSASVVRLVTLMGTEMKTCTRCLVSQPHSSFYRSGNGLHGLNSRCKRCCGELYREWSQRPEGKVHKAALQRVYKQRPEYKAIHAARERKRSQRPEVKAHKAAHAREVRKQPEYKDRLALDRERRQRQKEEVFTFYGGFVCACCGELERSFLSLDHMNGDGAAHRKTFRGGIRMYRWLIRNKFPVGYQILCMNCNFGRRYTGVCPHQESKQGVGEMVSQ